MAARQRMAERLEHLYSSPGITDIHFLEHIRDRAFQCGDKHQGDDWPAARHHYSAALRTHFRITQLTGTKEAGQLMERGIDQMFNKVLEHEGKEAADKWRLEFASSN